MRLGSQQLFAKVPNFHARIIFTDGSSFIRHGQAIRHWTYHWSRETPHEIEEVHCQHVEKLNIWCAIWDNIIIGLFFIEGNLIGDNCRNLFQNEVWPQLGPLLDANNDMQPILLLNGALAHTFWTVTEWSIQYYGRNWWVTLDTTYGQPDPHIKPHLIFFFVGLFEKRFQLTLAKAVSTMKIVNNRPTPCLCSTVSGTLHISSHNSCPSLCFYIQPFDWCVYKKVI